MKYLRSETLRLDDLEHCINYRVFPSWALYWILQHQRTLFRREKQNSTDLKRALPDKRGGKRAAFRRATREINAAFRNQQANSTVVFADEVQ